MFKANELNKLIICVESNISYLENFLDQYKDYLSPKEIKAKKEEIHQLRLLQVKAECILGNKAVSESLE